MNILLTGSSGFIGTNLMIYLNKHTAERVICVDKVKRNVEMVHKNLIDPTFFKDLPKIGLIIHCAADPCILSAYDNPRAMIDNNLLATINCLELARRDKSDFVFLSTNRVYPIKDRVRSLYGATKLCSEHLIVEYADMFGLRYVINRLSIISGKFQNGHLHHGPVSYWVKQHLTGGELNYIGYGGKGRQVRDILNVDDLCRLIDYEVNNMARVNGETFDVGGGIANSVSFKELTEIVQKVTWRKIKVGGVKENRKSDIEVYVSDLRHVKRVTGWEPRKTVKETVSDVFNYLLKRKETT